MPEIPAHRATGCQLGFSTSSREGRTSHLHEVLVKEWPRLLCLIFATPRNEAPVAEFHRQHPPGVADIAFLCYKRM